MAGMIHWYATDNRLRRSDGATREGGRGPARWEL